MMSKIQLLSTSISKATQIRWRTPITFILLLATVLYFYQLSTESLWIDELLSIKAAEQLIDYDIFLLQPLYYILLHIWMKFGISEAWLRGLSVLFGLGSVLLIYAVGNRCFGKKTGLIAAFLFTLSPLAINLAQEVRMYMMANFLGLAGTFVLVNFLEKPSVSTFRLWIVLRFLSILTKPINILTILADIVILGFRFSRIFRKKIDLNKWLWSIGLVLITSIFFAVILAPMIVTWIQVNMSSSVPAAEITAFIGGLVRSSVWPIKSPINGQFMYNTYLIKIYAVLVIGLLGTALFRIHRSAKLLWCTIWTFIPLSVIFGLSQVYGTLWGRDRYLFVAVPYVLILMAVGFERVLNWKPLVALLISGIYFLTISTALINYYTIEYRPDGRSAIHRIESQERPGDIIALFPGGYLPAFDYYYDGSSQIYTIGHLPKEKRFKTIDKKFVEKMLGSLPVTESRLWLMLSPSKTGLKDENNYIISFIEKQFYIKDFQEFTGIQLFLLNPRSATVIKPHPS